MGATFTYAVLPKCNLTPTRKAQALAAVAEITDEPESGRFETAEAFRKHLIDFLNKYDELDGYNSVNTICLRDGDAVYFITGDMTWGDSPSDPFDDFCDIDDTPLFDILRKFAEEDGRLSVGKPLET